MQVVKKVLLTIFSVWFAILLFMPKEEIYFSLERALAKEGIEINESSITEGVFGLEIEGITIYMEGIKVATIRKVSFTTLLLYSKLKIEELHTDKGLHSVFSLYLEKGTLLHTMLNPFDIRFRALGDVGELRGTIMLKRHRVNIVFSDKQKSRTIKSYLKKDKEGWYYGF